MDDPIKVIFKFKNNNRRIQYHIYIFIGETSKTVMNVLNNIQDKNLYDSFITLSTNDYNKIVQQYGDFWYKKFFNTYHINSVINNIKKSPQQQKELKDRFGQKWYEQHVEQFKLLEKKIFYSYEALIKDEILRKEGKRKKIREKEEEEKVDYRTSSKREEVHIHQEQFSDQIGGQQDDEYEDNQEQEQEQEQVKGEEEYGEGEEGLER